MIINITGSSMTEHCPSSPNITLNNKSSLPFYKFKRNKHTGVTTTPSDHNQSQILNHNCNSINTEIEDISTMYLSNQTMTHHAHTLSPQKGYSPAPNPPQNRPQKSRTTLSPSHIPYQLSGPVRSTLKNLMAKPSQTQHHSPPPGTLSRTTPVTPPQVDSLLSSQKLPQSWAQGGIKRMRAENSILREENELLRRELSEIKQIIIKDQPKQQEISNLRQTIKKQDSENKELRLKIDIQLKKIQAMEAMLASKEEEVSFLSGKVEQLELELSEEREGQAVRVLQLRERVMGVSEACCEMEERSAVQQREWRQWREGWLQEKTLYMHRIQFLQQYIAQNHNHH